ncbi:MAG: lysylphosphatidylglycerol synthase domain-containing protein [Candidatus Omnitrophota bacterium]
MKKVFLFIIWMAILAGLIYYLASHSGQLKGILELSVANVSMLGALFLLTQVLNGAEIMVLMEATGVKMRFLECFCLANISTAANYLPLKGGILARAFYLRKRHDLSYVNFADLTIAGALLVFLTIFASGAFFILINYIVNGEFFAGLFLIFLVLFFVFLALAVFMRLFTRIVKWHKLSQMGNGLRIILSKRSFLYRLLAIDLLAILALGLRFFVSFRILSFKAPLILSVLCGGVKKATAIMGLVPAGLGVSEISAGAVSELMKKGLDIGVFAASLDRVVSILVLLLAGSVSFFYLTKIKKAVDYDEQS